jgi:hypothetical protein
VNLINKTLIFLSLTSLSLSSLAAKTVEFLLDHKTKETFNLQLPVPEQRQEAPFSQPAFLHYCQQLKIENLGDHPIKNCFPYINHPPSLSLEDLARKLANERYPLLALYQLWNRSLIQDETIDEQNHHPLDLLNFQGACSRSIFNEQFLKLCNALGIETRLANVQGQKSYDFGLDDEWNFLDLTHHQLYLGLDNERLASSEDIMDDPFLALRTKHARQAKQMDFKEGWKQLAHFAILEPASAMPVILTTEKLSPRARGFDLFPGESLVFETPVIRPELAQHERSIAHTINLDARQVTRCWEYLSPFPIHQLVNNSPISIKLLDQKVKLQPGESYIFSESNRFQVRIAFADRPKGQLLICGTCAWTLFPSLTRGENQIYLGAKKNPSLVRFQYEVNDELVKDRVPSIHVCNQTHAFDYCSPSFMLESSLDNIEMIWWQIALDSHFQAIPSNFDQVESFTPIITLPAISETFLNPGTAYYFRVKGYNSGQWTEWSVPYAFVVKKPDAVEEVEFDQISENEYELNWERYAEQSDEPIEYFVFGSNSIDFIPSIYCESQVNAIVDGIVTEEEINDNLVAITTEPKIHVQGGLAYYRIVARQRGQFSVPSRIIHVYDQDLIQPRNVLQIIKDSHQIIAKRQIFPSAYPWTETALPSLFASGNNENGLSKLQSLLRSIKKLDKNRYQYEFPEVSEEIWEQVRPYLLPENHPAWSKLNRIFCNSRATLSPEEFKKAGFRRWRPGRWSRVAASSHPECQEYFIKAYCDTELGIFYDWKKWIHRIKGAQAIRQCIKDNNLQANFKVPHKWIYPLPKRPAPPNSSRYLRKNFILICENMRILEHSKNEKMYKKHMTRKLMDGLYCILQTCGLYDSVYVFNIPFCKDGRIAVIDTEYHHKWPVPFYKLTKCFSKDLRPYWEKITYKGGRIPDGINQPNPPRMDRRDAVKRE